MTYAKRRKPRQNTESSQQEKQRATDTDQRRKPSGLDRNGDERIDLDDLLIGVRECIQWVISWRGAMVLFLAGMIASAGLNVSAWMTAIGAVGAIAWAVVQMFEMLPVFDSVGFQASISSLVRQTRRPLEIPALPNEPHANRLLKRYKNRARNADIQMQFVRYCLYGVELAVLIFGGGIVNAVGISWGNILLTVLSAVGVELCYRMFSYCGEQLLSQEEREFLEQIKASAKRSTVSIE